MPVPSDPSKIFKWVMREFAAGKLHAGPHGPVVTDRRQAFAIAASMTRAAKAAKGETMAKPKKRSKKTAKKRSKKTTKKHKLHTKSHPRRMHKAGRAVKRGKRAKVGRKARKSGAHPGRRSPLARARAKHAAGEAAIAHEVAALAQKLARAEAKVTKLGKSRRKIRTTKQGVKGFSKKRSHVKVGRGVSMQHAGKHAKKHAKKRQAAKQVTAASILRPVSGKGTKGARVALKHWACVGPRRTGCGGGKSVMQGSRVDKSVGLVPKSVLRQLGLGL